MLRLLTEKEIKEDGLLSLLIFRPSAAVTYFAAKLGGFKGWATDTVKTKIPPYPRNEGAYEHVIVDENGKLSTTSQSSTNVGIRPAISYDEIKDECVEVGTDHCGITYVTYGEYPQMLVTNYDELKNLKKTEKQYDIPTRAKSDSLGHLLFDENGLPYAQGIRKPFFNQHHYFPQPEEDLLGIALPYKKAQEYISENGNKYVQVNNDWYKVEPIKWRVEKENNIAITDRVIAGGVTTRHIKDFVENHLSKDIKPSKKIIEQKQEQIEEEKAEQLVQETNQEPVQQQEEKPNQTPVVNLNINLTIILKVLGKENELTQEKTESEKVYRK